MTGRNPDRLFSMRPTARFERLRKQYVEFSSRPSPLYCIHVDRIIARVMRETEGEAMVLRRAKAFSAVVSEVPIDILEDEPFVGWISGRPDAVLICAEQKAAFLERELEGITSLSDEEKKIVREEIISYWSGDGGYRRSRVRQVYEMYPPELRTLLYGVEDPAGELAAAIPAMRVRGIPFVAIEDGLKEVSTEGVIGEQMSQHHIGHCSHGYEKVLRKGFLGIKEDVEKRLARLDPGNPDDLKLKPFLKAVKIAMEGAAGIGIRFAALAREKAREESAPDRRLELIKIAEVCERVPALPARTFREALQSVWFVHILHWWETPMCAAVSPGRVDQFLFPFYQKDIESSRICAEEVQELIDCWLLRMTQDAAPYVAESGDAHHIDLGGYREDGSDGVNELSFMFLEGMMHTRLNEPNLGVLVHSKSPDKFLIRACELASLGNGQPMFLNADVFIENILARGTLGGSAVPIELARRSGAIGCNEPHVIDHESDHQLGASIVMPAVLELTLGDGCRKQRLQLGPKTGDPRTFSSFDELKEAFRKQLSYLVKMCAIAVNTNELVLADVYPSVYQSALIEDCIENGISREEGGARFNFGPCIATLGAVDVGNSLAAIRKLVFEEKEISMDRLLKGLADNFNHDDLLRQKLLAAPKFGNDDDFVDEIVVWIMKVFCEEVTAQKNTRGGHMMPYQNPLGTYVPYGAITPAMASGRKAGEPLSDGISPTIGSDVSGPTAVIKSVGKIDTIRLCHGQSLNMRLDGTAFQDTHGIGRFVSLIRTFLDQKIHHIQFNLVSNETLRAAQEHPEDYQDLIVRVAGYCAYFVNLRKKVQDSIIARTIHGK